MTKSAKFTAYEERVFPELFRESKPLTRAEFDGLVAVLGKPLLRDYFIERRSEIPSSSAVYLPTQVIPFHLMAFGHKVQPGVVAHEFAHALMFDETGKSNHGEVFREYFLKMVKVTKRFLSARCAEK